MIKVGGFISYEDADGLPDSGIGGFGGIVDGWPWSRYEETFNEDGIEYIRALRDYIIENNIKRGGDWHQNSESGVPLFSDGTVAIYSYRAWGDLMAAIWGDIDGEPYSYMDFYMDRRIKEAK